MVGKIFLFLPGAVVIVMFPRLSGLNAKQLETGPTLKKSLLYVLGLSIFAAFVYNILPYTVLEILTGKAYPQAVFLGRLFSISMCLFALLSVLINYFLAVKDLRFLKYLVGFTACQFLAIAVFHRSLAQIQVIMCINAALLFWVHLFLAFRPLKLKA
jgi:O-antigen/teichoic acid export membrane protein